MTRATAEPSARPALRAIRREPLLVDDRLLVTRLTVAAPGQLGAVMVSRHAGKSADRRLSPDLVRWARAWLVCWHAALVADPRYGRDEPWTIALPFDTVTWPHGLSDQKRRAGVLAALDRAGVLSYDGDAAQATSARLDKECFIEHRAALALDWPAAVAACDREPATLLVLRALAEHVVPPDALAAVPRRDLVARTGYQQKQVRVALRRLAAASIIDTEGDVGETARYRFTARAIGREWGVAGQFPETPAPAGARTASVAAVNTPAPMLDPGGIRVVVGGVTVTLQAGADFSVGKGFSAAIELGGDGQPELRITPPSREA